VIEFLGFNPFELGHTLGERLASFRRERSMSQKDFAREFGGVPPRRNKEAAPRSEDRGLRPTPRMQFTPRVRARPWCYEVLNAVYGT
jgi:hypothetical protein